MSEIRQTDSGAGNGIEGADGEVEAAEIKKQKEEAEKNEAHIDPDVSTEEGVFTFRDNIQTAKCKGKRNSGSYALCRIWINRQWT